MRELRIGAMGLFWTQLLACGSNEPEIPPELLDAIAHGAAGSAGDYPPGPYGGSKGDTLADVSLLGWENPQAEGYDLDALETLRFSDHYDPTGEGGAKLLLVNTAAVWCQPCQAEHSTLSERYDEFEPRGLRILSGLFQDEKQDPPTPETLRVWSKTFESNYPMALDPEFLLGRLGSAATPPVNAVVDTTNMKIIEVFVGNQEGPLWGFIENALGER